MKIDKRPTKAAKRIAIFAAVLLFLGLAFGSTQAQSTPGGWLPFGENPTQGGPVVELVSADGNEIVLQASFAGIEYTTVEIDGSSYTSLSAAGYDTAGAVGQPALPVVHRLIEIPYGAQVDIEVTSLVSQVIKMDLAGLRYPIVPRQPAQPKCGDPIPNVVPDRLTYQSAQSVPQSPVTIVKETMVRGHRLILLEMAPVRYNPASAELDTISEVNIRLKLTGSDVANTLVELNRLSSSSFDDVLSGSVMNYNLGQTSLASKTGERYLIITANVYESALASFVSLKQSQGFSVSLVNLSTTGTDTTSIKNYIRGQYQGTTPPVYVLLVGDYNDGEDSLTNWPFRSSGQSSYRTDLEYFTMDGNTDFVPDMLYGRFPVRDVVQVGNITAKLVAYEAANGSEVWVKKAEFLASNDSSFYDVAEATHNYVINTYTLPKGYSGIFPNNPQPGGDKIYAITYGGTGANAVTSMNDDRSFVVYSGHGASTFWDNPRVTQTDIRNLTGVAIPYIGSHACVTADFNTNESFGDTWIVEPVNGALTYLGASDNSYWDEDDLLERTIFDTLYADPAMVNVPSVGAFRQAGLLAVDDSGSSLGNYYWEEYHIFGDPSLKITLKPKYPDFSVSVTPGTAKVCNTGSVQAEVSLGSQNNFASPVNLNISTVTGFGSQLNPASPIVPPNSTTLTLSGNGTATLGTQTVVVTGTSGSLTHSAELALSVYPQVSTGPQLSQPGNGAVNVSPKPTFSWVAIPQAETYTLEVATDAAFTHVVISKPGITTSTYTPLNDLPTDTAFYWRVSAVNICGSAVSAEAFSFTTRPGPGDCPVGTVKSSIFVEDFETGMDGWSEQTNSYYGVKWELTTVRALSPSHAVLATVPEKISDQRLASPALAVPQSANPISLIFWHRWTFDSQTSCNDGGILESSVNNGTTWKIVPVTSILTTPYNGVIASGSYNPMTGKTAWCGTSDWVRSVVDLESFKGQTVQFRFRLGSGVLGAAEGWYLDDFALQQCVDPASINRIFMPFINR